MDDTIEIIREARKAGMQMALLMFMALIVVSGLFGLYIYKSFDTPPTGVLEANLDNQNGNNTVTQDIK